ncbi:MAG: radical SAM protein [Candidatus Bathyarchaeia archaeon]
MVAPPYLVSYSITRKCNLKCKHCYSDAIDKPAPDELSTAEAKRLLDDIANWGIKLLIIDGGEPLCRDDFYEIVEYASNKGIKVVVGSNGTLIDKQSAIKMKEAKVQCVAISIDGAKPETHDSFRGEDGAFHKAIEGARICREVGLPFQFNIVIRKQTLNEIPDMLKLAVESGANAVEFFDLVQVSRVKERCLEEVLDKSERRKVMEWLAETQRDCPIVIRVPTCPMYPLILKEKKIQPKQFPASVLTRIPYYDRGCAAGMPNGYITVLSNGDVIPCMLLQVKLGNIREKNIVKIWEESPILAKLRSRELLEGECGKCAYRNTCAGCRGRAYEETGNVLASDPGCWLI